MMAQYITSAVAIASLLLVSVTPALADLYSYNKHVARQDLTPCVPDQLIGQVNSSNGGRKIGMVIDASGSMQTSDPSNIRLVAAKALNQALVSKDEATNGKVADLVTVVKFSGTADLLYPLGDPAGADRSIAGIIPGGQTAIGAGVKTAIDDLTKPGNDPTANRTGLIVFTDGVDNPSSGKTVTIEQLKRAGGLGIRVFFGFLSPDSTDQDTEILRAILNSGGKYATVQDPSSQQAFVTLALTHGLTGVDGVNGSNTLLPGIATAAFLGSGANTFDYTAKAGETININVTAIDPVNLKVTLRDVKANSEIKSNATGTTRNALLEYSATADTDLEVQITAANTSASGIFSVGLKSSIPLTNNCNITSNTTQPASSPTSSQPAVFTGGATFVIHSAPSLFTVFSVFCFVVAAAVL